MGNKDVRLYEHITIDKKTAQKLFSQYDNKIELTNLTLIPEGMSTSNYIVDIKNSSKKYLLKIYPEGGGNSAIEAASYSYAKQYVNVPNIHLFDNSKKIYNNPYVIMDYIEGMSLKEYIIKNKKFPNKIAYDIGSKLALLHRREYKNRGLLNKNLDIKKNLPPITDLHEQFLNGIPGTHINSKIKNELLESIDKNKELLKKLDTTFVYSHGDFYPANILIDNKDNSVWFIDFEYSLSAPIYYDIGKFFRDRAYMDKYGDKSTYDNFIRGYNEHAKNKVSDDWIKISRLADMTGMLSLINKENPPMEWVKGIEDALKRTLRILRNEIEF
ncbi:aminoglycoside phosphotransferase family protein [Oceanirhabdus seepicola]|uniref:Aminoglycoside phosphotransferase family protein n=1 Tax=Oceanirhabdus seepicola TaxID=2828781 RepID=A0A9J6P105_9CLOT|nr:aminoglycoside phosphotransferase family protein [Oceanirhabdus seepicola]MCM1989120.1 aminoglycoside phosphotransferase family protein [Oceanirhabdus seepicola]